MLFSLKDLYSKVNQQKWGGSINFYPSEKKITNKKFEQHISWLEQNVSLAFADKVIVIATPTPETIMTILWFWKNGIVVVPVKHDMSLSAIEKIAENCEAAATIKDLNFKLRQKKNAEIVFREYSHRQVCGSDLALIIYTSGSTGQPKGIMLSHTNVITAIYSIGNYLRIDKREHILGLSPLSFDYGFYQVLFSLAFDCQLTLFEEQYHPIKVLKAIETNNITLLPVVPSMATSLSKMIQVFKKTLPSLSKLTNTGGHLGESVIEALTDSLPQLQVFAMYGLTECKRALYLPPEDVKKKKGSVGIAIPGLEAKLFNDFDSNGQKYYQEAEPGNIGELFVRGATVMQGYYGESHAGANIVSGSYRDDNWLATGDLFVRDECGYFYFKGRRKELIKQAGFCIYPTEVEAMIEKNSLVNLAAIISSTDKFGDEIACLCIQLHQDSEVNRSAFEDWLFKEVDVDYRPRTIKYIENMQLTANGKVDKKCLVNSL